MTELHPTPENINRMLTRNRRLNEYIPTERPEEESRRDPPPVYRMVESPANHSPMIEVSTSVPNHSGNGNIVSRIVVTPQQFAQALERLTSEQRAHINDQATAQDRNTNVRMVMEAASSPGAMRVATALRTGFANAGITDIRVNPDGPESGRIRITTLNPAGEPVIVEASRQEFLQATRLLDDNQRTALSRRHLSGSRERTVGDLLSDIAAGRGIVMESPSAGTNLGALASAAPLPGSVSGGIHVDDSSGQGGAKRGGALAV